MFTPNQISFRRMAMEDLPLMHTWLNSDGLKDIWDLPNGITMEEVFAKYAHRIRGESPTTCFLILFEGRPIGMIQHYLWRGYPDYLKHLDLNEEAASLDVFIGGEAYRDRGLGPIMLRRFLQEVTFACPEAESCVITPEAWNERALRAYEKAGFRRICVMEHPDESQPVCLMRISREEAMGDASHAGS